MRRKNGSNGRFPSENSLNEMNRKAHTRFEKKSDDDLRCNSVDPKNPNRVDDSLLPSVPLRGTKKVEPMPSFAPNMKEEYSRSMSRAKMDVCKYCHLQGHVIDKCPTIICKHCRKVGHPIWICPNNPNAEKRNPLSYVSNEAPLSHSEQMKGSSLEKTAFVPNTHEMPAKAPIYEKMEFVQSSVICDPHQPLEGVPIRKVPSFVSDSGTKSMYCVEEEEQEIKKEIIDIRYYQNIIDFKWGDLC